jgi:ribosomal protein S18 acetylase RimI-like enzyme
MGYEFCRTGGGVILTPYIRSFAQHEWAIYKDLRLRALADALDAFGSTLAKEQSRSDAEWARRLAPNAESRDLPLVAVVAGEAIGLAWGRIEKSTPDTANLYQMWVAPGYRRLGAGKMLLDAVIAWAKTQQASCLELGVTCGNSPAWRLYSRAGFEPVGPPQPLRPGSELLGQTMRLIL